MFPSSAGQNRSVFYTPSARGNGELNANSPLHERIEAASLTPSETRVASLMSSNPALVAVTSTVELGRLTSTSDATVVRTAKKLGYANFRELRRSALAISGRHRDPSKVLDDQVGQVGGSPNGAAIVMRDTASLLATLEESLDETAWENAVAALSQARRVMTYGSGPSGCVADYLGLALTRVGLLSESVTTTGFRLADHLLSLSKDDVVVLFATLRRFREIDVIIDRARTVGATTVLVSETLGESLRPHVDVVLATPQSTTGTSDGVIMGMVLAHALELAVAAQDQAAAVKSMQHLNALRGEIVGGVLDADKPLSRYSKKGAS